MKNLLFAHGQLAVVMIRGSEMTSSNVLPNNGELAPNSKHTATKSTAFSAYLSLENNPLIDIISAKYHSSDFNQTRANYVRGRLWLMCLFFAITVPAFAIIDFFILPESQAISLLLARCALSASLFSVAFVLRKPTSLPILRLCSLVAFLLPSLFYLHSMSSFANVSPNQMPIVYSMLPYLIVAMLGLFPLTILGGVTLISVVFVPFISYEISQYQDSLWPVINTAWLFMLFAGISLWLQTSQLSMLMKLYRESTVDPLTKLINRRVLMRVVEKEQIKNKEHNTPFSILMFDLDKFKRINDDYGHFAGDQVLVMAANVMKQVLGKSNTAARFGGEEFVGVLSGTTLTKATEIAEKLSQKLKAERVVLADGSELKVTASIGVIQCSAGESVEAAFKRADDLLYVAKDTGRDKVVTELSVKA